MNRQKLDRLATHVRTGGPGTVRRKKLVKRKNNTNDDKKLQASLKKLGLSPIPGIEEVSIFTNEDKVLFFKNPKVQANLAANTYVITGKHDTKTIKEMLPQFLSQLGDIKEFAEQVSGLKNEEIPNLETTNFEDTANKEEENKNDDGPPPLESAN
eukprot:TRINITY_DN25_c0_g1_i1.p1 TRINITY_DN25_c0_g1~~TRINITY_DN25_c0_g1_i1.p1  ORF type:complete len:155 (+),score=35.81 TRINITY_DN25_c0_g1_i1:139-603(+)